MTIQVIKTEEEQENAEEKSFLAQTPSHMYFQSIKTKNE
jgi:hypothetical protein